jgi:hypothetical protein
MRGDRIEGRGETQDSREKEEMGKRGEWREGR